MKIITLRVDDEIYDQIYNISKQTSTSLNKTTKNIIADYLKSPRTIASFLSEIENNLSILNREINTITRKQNLHLRISKQHFANIGYLSNADIKEDKCLKEIYRQCKNGFND